MTDLRFWTRVRYRVVGQGTVKVAYTMLGEKTVLDIQGLDPPPELLPGDRICVDGQLRHARYVVLRPRRALR